MQRSPSKVELTNLGCRRWFALSVHASDSLRLGRFFDSRCQRVIQASARAKYEAATSLATPSCAE